MSFDAHKKYSIDISCLHSTSKIWPLIWPGHESQTSLLGLLISTCRPSFDRNRLGVDRCRFMSIIFRVRGKGLCLYMKVLDVITLQLGLETSVCSFGMGDLACVSTAATRFLTFMMSYACTPHSV